jgi:hypothetical protein
MMTNGGSKIAVNPHVIARSMSDGIILINTETGDCFELNGMGSEIWNELQSESSIDEVAESIASRHSAEPTVVKQDIRLLLDRLAHHGIVSTAL